MECRVRGRDVGTSGDVWLWSLDGVIVWLYGEDPWLTIDELEHDWRARRFLALDLRLLWRGPET